MTVRLKPAEGLDAAQLSAAMIAGRLFVAEDDDSQLMSVEGLSTEQIADAVASGRLRDYLTTPNRARPRPT